MPEGMLLSDDLPIFLRDIQASHSPSEQAGVEGGTAAFLQPYVFTGNDLPKIRHTKKEKNCADCNNPTHLEWTSPIAHMRYRLCQGCAKRRGNIYQIAIERFTRA